MVAVRVLKPSFQPSLPVQVPLNRPPLRVVPPPPNTPPATPGTGFGRLFGGVGVSISMLWTAKTAYDAVKAVPSQLPWMPGPSVSPEIWTDPERVMAEAHARFGHIDTPQLNQLLFIREKQALPMRRDVMRNPHDRSLMVQDEKGNWVQVPLNGQETGALVIGDLWKNGFPRNPTHQRASDEVRLIELELGRRDYQDTPKTDADKTWFEQYAEYIRDLAEALRKRANGENVVLPMFIFDIAEETKMGPKTNPQAICSKGKELDTTSATNGNSDEIPTEQKSQPATTGNSSNIPDLKNNKAVVASRYNRYSTDYEGHSKEMGATMDITVSDYLSRHIKANTQLLDIAGGDGLATSKIGPTKPSITIMDLSKGMLEAARRLRRNVIKTIEGDFDNKLPFPNTSFDYVTCISALEFAKDLRFTIGEMLRVTKQGGLILITTDRLEESSGVQMGLLYIHDVNGFFSRRHTTSEVLRVIADLGGKIIGHGIHNAYRLEEQWVKYDYFLIEKQ